MSTARESIEVAVPVAIAYEKLAHLENYPQFMSGVMSMAPIDASTAHMVLDLGGNRAEFDARITEARPGEFLAWEATNGPQVCEALRLEPMADDMTRVIAELQIDARELMPGEQHAVEVLNRRLKADLKGFKRFCEEYAARAAAEAEERGAAPTAAAAQESGAAPTAAATREGTAARENGPTASARPSPATIARGIASASKLTHATNERPGQPMPPAGNLGPMRRAAEPGARAGQAPRRRHDL
ncbi:SRPBCC family protein [Dactylosporangium sp. NPDC048998]|uniref:SRPBCC family protein n=1 Tax=Dactylosporangium sp. NPDC048998 TaxID=3363976 RepID=UPI00371D2B3A